jgi:hypothetical protein
LGDTSPQGAHILYLASRLASALGKKPTPLRRGWGGEGEKRLVHIHAVDVQPIRADTAVNDEQVLRLRAAAKVKQHGQQVGVVHNAVAVDIHRRVAGAEREQIVSPHFTKKTAVVYPLLQVSPARRGNRAAWFPWYITTSTSAWWGSPSSATGVGASVPLRHQARSEHTPDAHTNQSPNPCKGNQPETPGRCSTRARFATQLYLTGGTKQ